MHSKITGSLSNSRSIIGNNSIVALKQVQALMDNLSTLVWIKDADKRFVTANESFSKFCGKTIDSIIGLTDYDLWSHELASSFELHENEVRLTGKQKVVEEKIYNQTSELWLETQRIPIFDDKNNEVIGIIAVARNINERKKLEISLKEQKDFAEMLLRTIPSAVFSVDTEKRVTSWNKRTELITGYLAEEVLGKSCDTFSNQACKEACGMYSDKIGKPILGRFCSIRSKEGKIIQILKNADLLRDSEGKIIGGIECFEDVTEKVKMEEDLRESQSRLTLATTSARIGMWDWIVKTGEVVVNEQWASIIGYTLDELSPISIDTWHSLVHPEDKIISSDFLDKCFSKELDYYECEARMKHKDGRWVWILDRGRVIEWDADNKPLRMVGTHIEITERKLAEEELSRKEKMLSALSLSIKELLDNRDFFEAALKSFDIVGKAIDLDVIYLFQNSYNEDGKGSFTGKISWSKSGQRRGPDDSILYNISFESIEAILIPLLNQKLFYCNIDDIQCTEAKQLLQSNNINSMTFFPVFTKNSFWGFVGFNSCIKERKWTNSELSILSAFSSSLGKALERRLIEEELEISRKSAEAANVLKSQFLANMSHEIRTPMNGIVGFLDLLGKTGLTSEQREYLRDAKTATEVLLYLINDILDFSKIEAGKLDIEETSFNLRTAIEEAAALLAPKAVEKNVELLCMIKPNVPNEVLGDSTRLKQVLNNLLSNAIKFTENGEVEVTVEISEVYENSVLIRIEVRDTGIGISEDDISKLFKPFTQADSSTTRKYGGTGLGLAISSELVKKMGGNMGLKSIPGKGSSFYFTVKFKTTPQQSATLLSLEALEKKNIMIIDKNNNNRKIIKAYLEDEGCNIFESSSPSNSISVILNKINTNEQIDIAIIDFNTPEMDGYQLAHSLKAIPLLKDLHLILLFSAKHNCNFAEAKKQGFSGCLSKPVRHDELIRCLATATGQITPQNNIENTVFVESDEKEIINSNPSILLVEDNEMNKKIMVMLLNKCDIPCDVSVNGLEAYKAVTGKDYDIVFMDCQMPVMDGYRSTALIREYEKDKKHTTIIAMTANAMEGDREKCLAAGMDDYISKPIDLDMILSKIKQYTKSKDKTAVPGFLEDSLAAFMSSSGLDRKESVSLFNDFIKMIGSNIKELEAALKFGDFTFLRNLAHQLKGTSGNLRIMSIYNLFVDLEKSAADENKLKCESTLQKIADILHNNTDI